MLLTQRQITIILSALRLAQAQRDFKVVGPWETMQETPSAEEFSAIADGLSADYCAIQRAVAGIDWNKLHGQKAVFVNMLPGYPNNPPDELQGILHLIDALQDAAEEDGLWRNPYSPKK